MPLYEIEKASLKAIPTTTFGLAQVKERQDLQRLLRTQVDVLAPDLMVVAEEFGDWQDSNRRVDLLGLDRQANLVVIELKRTQDGGHMDLQAIRYAAMVSTMTFDQVCQAYGRFLQETGSDGDPEAQILQFLDWDEPDEERFAQDVRIVLAAADFSKEITTAVMWLNEQGLDIRCVRLRPHSYDGKVILDVQQLIPLPETEEFQVKIRDKAQAERSYRRGDRKWDRDSFCKELGEKKGKADVNIALEILDWVTPRVTRIWWGEGRVSGSFVPILEEGGLSHQLFAVRTGGHVELYFYWMSRKPPFDDETKRGELMVRLNQLDGVEIPEGALAKYPKISLALLANSDAMRQFQEAFTWVIRCDPEREPETMTLWGPFVWSDTPDRNTCDKRTIAHSAAGRGSSAG